MLNEKTIISSFDNKLTLMQWLKNVEKALKEGSAKNFEVVKKGEATISFKLTFMDDTFIESNDIVLQQGETGVGIASVRLDATNHLIVTYTNGNVEDAGQLFSENLNVSGLITALKIEQSEANEQIAFNFVNGKPSQIELTNAYNRAIVVNGILYLIANIKMKNIDSAVINIGGAWGGTPYIAITLPSNVASKVFDIDGISAHEVGTNRKLITSVHASCISGTLGEANAKTFNDFRFDLTNVNNANQVACYFNSNTNISLEPNEEITLMARVAITLF